MELLPCCLRTRWYRAPELFLGSRGDSSVDLWSAGCTIAELILRRPWVPGSDTRDMLFRICGELGAPDDSEGWPLAAQLVEASGRKNAEPAAWQSLREAGASQAAVDMLESLLRYDGQRRLRCDRALREMPFFSTEEPEVPVPVPVSRPLSPATLQRSREESLAAMEAFAALFSVAATSTAVYADLKICEFRLHVGQPFGQGRFSELTTQSNVLLLIWSLLRLVELAFRDGSGNLMSMRNIAASPDARAADVQTWYSRDTTPLTWIRYSGEPFFGGLGIFVSAAYAVTMHNDQVSVHFIRKAVRDGRLRLNLSSRIPTEEEWRQDQVIAHAPQLMTSLVTAATRDAALLERHLPRYSACLLSVWQASKLWPYPFMYSFRHWSHHVGFYVAAFGTSSLLAALHWRLLWWRTQYAVS
eukprot:s4533_g3.t3